MVRPFGLITPGVLLLVAAGCTVTETKGGTDGDGGMPELHEVPEAGVEDGAMADPMPDPGRSGCNDGVQGEDGCGEADAMDGSVAPPPAVDDGSCPRWAYRYSGECPPGFRCWQTSTGMDCRTPAYEAAECEEVGSVISFEGAARGGAYLAGCSEGDAWGEVAVPSGTALCCTTSAECRVVDQAFGDLRAVVAPRRRLCGGGDCDEDLEAVETRYACVPAAGEDHWDAQHFREEGCGYVVFTFGPVFDSWRHEIFDASTGALVGAQEFWGNGGPGDSCWGEGEAWGQMPPPCDDVQLQACYFQPEP